ncbi:MAG: diacylglycerol kinase family lipid kinase [Anaerolineae bacterium]|nr:diacylglycerol kinase family lipid kinase [Anaerolineae bacterium]
MESTLVIVNPYAAGGRAGRIWAQHEAEVYDKLGDVSVVVTHHVDELPDTLAQATDQGVRRVVSVGGDGTNHAVLNALMAHNATLPDDPVSYGIIPAGTGRDFARGSGLSLKPSEAIGRLADAMPRMIDVGHVAVDDKSEYFLNIADACIGNDVVQRVEAAGDRRPWTFLSASVQSLLRYQPEPVRITLDSELFYDDNAYIVVVANGTTFGYGMQIAPEARIDDGWFDVIVVEAMPRWEILLNLRLIYSGTHLSHPKVHTGRAKTVTIESDGRIIGMDLDGEPAEAHRMTFSVKPLALPMLW